MAPKRRSDGVPVVSIEVAPAFELLVSLVATAESDEAETYEVGAEWIAEARARAGDELLARIAAVSHGDPDTFTHLVGLAWDAPAPRDVPSFLEHMRRTDAEEILLHLVQYYSREIRRQTPADVIRRAVAGDQDARDEFLRTSYPEWEPWTDYLRGLLDADRDAFKADLIGVIEAWADRVWKPESVSIMPILERDADAKRQLLRDVPFEEFVTTATNGVEFPPRPGVERVAMLPSFLNRPLVSYLELGETLIIVYPVADESVSADADAPPLRLVRLSKALGDEKRLRILRALSEGEKSLMDLAETFGVAKTTMHHHMIVLRSAGLVSVAVGSKRYRLRHDAVPNVGTLLSGYLGAATGPSVASRSPARPRRRRTGTEG
jgi:DNA-binding transcriptional ArsR family regulator